MFNFSKKSFPLKGIDEGHHNVTYKGVPALKCPFDYVLYQMLIFEVQPDLIIEIGTNKGGSTLYLADLLALQNKGEIHTIDLPSNTEDVAVAQHDRIKIFKDGFQQYDTTVINNYKTVMVIEDGSHFYADSLDALRRFSGFVTPGSYFIVEDGIVTDLGKKEQYNGGPERAVEEFLQHNEAFIVDRKWCDFFGHNATFNTNGYLKRIK